MDMNNLYLGQAEIISRERQIRLPEWAKAENMEMCYSYKELYRMFNCLEASDDSSSREKNVVAGLRAALADNLRRLANIISPEIQLG